MPAPSLGPATGRRCRCLAMVWVALLIQLAAAIPAIAHDLGISKVEIEELPDARYRIEAELPPALVPLTGPPGLPERCTLDDPPGSRSGSAGILRHELVCETPLTASDVLLLPWDRQGVMVTVDWLDGSSARQLFAGSGGVIAIELSALQAGSGSLLDAARRYLELGIEHILLGFDHLLFVLGLLLIVRGVWMLVKTITAFTVAHSITLALATLGVVDLPSRPVEAVIALSIVFLAAEFIHGRQGRPGLTGRMPWVVAFAFGLLHGLGFASALAELGMAPGEVPVALLFFNLGVEIGQLLFVGAVLALAHVAHRLLGAWPRWLIPLPAYAIGTIAAFWLIERTSAMLPTLP